ncbi:MAG: TraB/GumN family protein [Pseudomonadota bacterium]
MNKLLLLAASAAIAFLASAKHALTEETPEVSERASPAMWRIVDNDTEIFLIGSFPVLPEGASWRTPAFDAALAKSRIVYFDADGDSPDARSKAIGIMMTDGFNPPGTALDSMLAADDLERLRSVAQEVGLPFAGINALKPWRAALSLSVQYLVRRGFDPGAGFEKALLNEAKTLGKEIRYLNTIEDQFSLFTELGEEQEKDFLIITLRDWRQRTDRFDETFRAWQAGDTAFVDDTMNAPMRNNAPSVYERLTVQRNQDWVNDINSILETEKGAVIVVAGIAQLTGPDSIPSMLKEKGNAVSRYGSDER